MNQVVSVLVDTLVSGLDLKGERKSIQEASYGIKSESVVHKIEHRNEK